ncbi:hypothetical protein [Rhodococcus cercidiphylli]|uniref:DUF3263 domain-containing protein n=1 Tax=Rhodococcus cercidiphylli TaxID=489916 RepID=A0ABU4AV24_9NOCA|nr:hypothetical protein [Rhodococcus cercidiphylli]MDV6230084.1 hypothetical protein [Rhodococcus cercidiphylli]
MTTISDKPVATGNPPACAGVECDDREMIDHAIRWVNSGGGPETEICAHFGVPGRVFYRNVLARLERSTASQRETLGVSSVLAARIAAVARRRIWISS